MTDLIDPDEVMLEGWRLDVHPERVTITIPEGYWQHPFVVQAGVDRHLDELARCVRQSLARVIAADPT